uniref:Uncharacterized protein n=1 Tax=Arundo donax TaxID=35708 RepID=A0A0A9H6L6_ARUDO
MTSWKYTYKHISILRNAERCYVGWSEERMGLSLLTPPNYQLIYNANN